MNLSIQQPRNFEREPYRDVLPVARGMDLVLRSYYWQVTATLSDVGSDELTDATLRRIDEVINQDVEMQASRSFPTQTSLC